jgi:hypothetical protein
MVVQITVAYTVYSCTNIIDKNNKENIALLAVGR